MTLAPVRTLRPGRADRHNLDQGRQGPAAHPGADARRRRRREVARPGPALGVPSGRHRSRPRPATSAAATTAFRSATSCHVGRDADRASAASTSRSCTASSARRDAQRQPPGVRDPRARSGSRPARRARPSGPRPLATTGTPAASASIAARPPPGDDRQERRPGAHHERRGTLDRQPSCTRAGRPRPPGPRPARGRPIPRASRPGGTRAAATPAHRATIQAGPPGQERQRPQQRREVLPRVIPSGIDEVALRQAEALPLGAGGAARSGSLTRASAAAGRKAARGAEPG